MRVLCFGKSGLLSTELQQWLPELASESLVFIDKNECDITDSNLVYKMFEKHEPSVVINAVAYTKVDQCEDEYDLANQVNGHALEAIVAACNQYDATLLHFSTDYVFDGHKDGPYEESDTPNPINKYGESKLLGEQIILAACKKFYIMRVQWVFGPAKGNFIDTMLRMASEQSEIKVINDQLGSPTSTQSISKAVVNLLHNMPEHGIYHFRTLNHCSWYDYAKYIFEQKECDINVIPVSSDEFKTKAIRPKNSIMNIGKWIYSDLYTPLNWKQDVSAYLQLVEANRVK